LFKDKKVLVAGGTGFIGSNLIKRLLNIGANIRCTVHNRSPQILDRKIEYIGCDLRKPEDCNRATHKVDYVFMCSANTSGAAVMDKDPLAHVTPNVIMNSLILKSAYESNVKKLLFISTNTVYPPFEHAVKENEMMNGDLFEKYFCVGWMKRFSEILCEMYASKIKNNMPIVVVRPGNAYGEHDNFNLESSHVLPALIRKVVEKQNPICVWGDGNDIKDFIYIDDLIDGLLLSMEKCVGFDQINIAFGSGHSIKESLSMILKIENFYPKINFDQTKPTMIPKRLIDISKARKILNFTPKIDLFDGLQKTILWYKKSLITSIT